MAKKLVEYKLERYPVTMYDGTNYKVQVMNTIPAFIDDGGYFQLNGKIIGITHCSSNTHIPQTLVQPTRQELKDRAALMGMKKKVDEEFVDMTTQEISDHIDVWLMDKGFQDLA